MERQYRDGEIYLVRRWPESEWVPYYIRRRGRCLVWMVPGSRYKGRLGDLDRAYAIVGPVAKVPLEDSQI